MAWHINQFNQCIHSSTNPLINQSHAQHRASSTCPWQNANACIQAAMTVGAVITSTRQGHVHNVGKKVHTTLRPQQQLPIHTAVCACIPTGMGGHAAARNIGGLELHDPLYARKDVLSSANMLPSCKGLFQTAKRPLAGSDCGPTTNGLCPEGHGWLSHTPHPAMTQDAYGWKRLLVTCAGSSSPQLKSSECNGHLNTRCCRSQRA